LNCGFIELIFPEALTVWRSSCRGHLTTGSGKRKTDQGKNERFFCEKLHFTPKKEEKPGTAGAFAEARPSTPKGVTLLGSRGKAPGGWRTPGRFAFFGG
jgi:hypothetical protein